MNRILLCLCALPLGSGLAALDLSGLGDQPVAIGAGARALGMGGAFSAVADDATATTWNPAGLTQCERPELSASLGYWYSRVEPRAADPEETLRPEHAAAMLPFFAGGCMQMVGISWQRQYDFARRLNLELFSDANDGTVEVIDSSREKLTREGAFSSLGLSYAVEIHPGLSLGVTVNEWGDRFTHASSYEERTSERLYSSFSFVGVTPPISETTSDITSTTTSTVRRGTSVVLGVMWQALPSLTVAVVAKPAYHLDLETVSSFHQRDDDGAGTITENGASSTTRSTLHHPPSATLGLAWRRDDLDTVSFDATWTRWRDYYIDTPGRRFSPITVNIEPEDFRDLWTLRLGYEHVLILSQMIVVPRCGALADWLPAATATESAATADQARATSDLWLGLTAGASLVQRRVTWDAAVQVRHGSSVGAGQFAPPYDTADVTIFTARTGVTIPF